MDKRSQRANGGIIVALRRQKAWQQAELAKLVGCSKRTIENAEASRLVLLETIGRLAETFRVDPTVLVLPDNSVDAQYHQSDQSGGDATRIRRLLANISDASNERAARAAKTFLSLWHTDNASVTNGLAELLRYPIPNVPSFDSLAGAQRPIVRAYRDFHEAISSEEALLWLRQPTTAVYALSETAQRKILAAEVHSGDKQFTAAWIDLGAGYDVLLINRDLKGDDRILSVYHELEHLVDYSLTSNFTRSGPDSMSQKSNIGSNTGESSDRNRSRRSDQLIPPEAPIHPVHEDSHSPITLFALAQKQVDPDDKELAAKWVARDLPLTNGAGIFVDAGSQCMAVWKAIMHQIENNRFANLAVVTNSLLVLQDWPNSLTMIPQLQGTTVEPAGEIFDAPHLAFYGEAVRWKLMSPHFRASAVYIGASGIEFSEQGQILLGYHAGEFERASKELLFQCPCKDARVILATPKKIGNPGGRVFDMLAIKDLDPKAPIYLVSAEPKPQSPEEDQFEEAKRILRSRHMQDQLRALGVRFHWITIDRRDLSVQKAKEHIIVPENIDPL